MKFLKNNYRYMLLVLSVLLLNIPMIANAQPANSAFDDDAFYECIVDTYNSINNQNYGYDVSLSDEELATINNLNCHGKLFATANSKNYDINNVTGINKLVNLESLNLYGNKLTSIDLSENVNLNSIEMENNSLTTIDLSQNTNLANIDLWGNKLTSIDLSNNIKLGTLVIGNSELSTLDLSHNVNLFSLDLVDSSVTNLNLSNNTKLEYLYLYNNSNLSSLDLSANTNLVSLDLGESQISNLDLKNNTKLEVLWLGDVDLTTIDLSNNTNLKSLTMQLSGNIPELHLEKNTSLQDLEVGIPSNLNNITISVVKGVHIKLYAENLYDVLNISNSSTDSIGEFNGNEFINSNVGSTVLTLEDGRKVNIFSGVNGTNTNSSEGNSPQEVEVPNTASTYSIMLILFSVVLVGLGAIILVRMKNKINNE